MSYGIHKVTSVHGTMRKKLFVNFQKGQKKIKVKTTGLVHNFIILGNVETMIKGQMVQWVMVSTKWPPFMV